MKTRTKGANGDKKIAKDLRGPNLSIDGKWRSFPKVPNLLQYVITGSFYGSVKVDGKIYRESLEVSKARFTGRQAEAARLRHFEASQEAPDWSKKTATLYRRLLIFIAHLTYVIRTVTYWACERVVDLPWLCMCWLCSLTKKARR